MRHRAQSQQENTIQNSKSQKPFIELGQRTSLGWQGSHLAIAHHDKTQKKDSEPRERLPKITTKVTKPST